MLSVQTINAKLDSLIHYLETVGVTVSLSREEAKEVTIAQLRNQHIVINTRNRDGLNCLFTVAHLFGHLVQNLNYDRYSHLTSRVEGAKPVVVDDAFRVAFYEYEVEAFRIGKGLMQACFEADRELDSKYTLFMETDFAHFWHFITTGERGDAATFNEILEEAYLAWPSNERFLSPLPHPKPIRLERPVLVDVV